MQSFSEFFSLLIGFTNALMFSMNVRVFINNVQTFLANALMFSMNVRVFINNVQTFLANALMFS
ncbi:hypothetical protein BLD44_012065, partial [Mastigocladus laminosus UU774]